jgi:ribosomal protein S18 acetylase RimI-like enzyme
MWPFNHKPKEKDCCCGNVSPQHSISIVYPAEQFAYDMQEVLEIEYANFHPYHWVAKDFRRLFSHNGTIYTYCDNSHVVGYLCFSPIRSGIALKSISIRKDYQRIGMGTKMLQGLKNKLLFGRKIIIHVSEKNTAAHLFFKAMGFEATRVKRDYFMDGSAAYVFKWEKGSEQGDCAGMHESYSKEKQ